MKKAVNYILLLTSVAITFLLVEIGFRVVAYVNDLNTLENIEQSAKPPQSGEIVSLGQIIRLSKNPRIIYEFIPNLSVIFDYKRIKKKQPVKTNGYGFRGKAFPVKKNPKSKRIVGIGDSHMFGWGIKEEETYLSLLTDLLNSNYPKYSWEIINTAVPGYNTVMEVETLKEKGLRFKPDMVIIHFCGNDFNLPHFIREQEDYFSLNQSFMVKYFKQTLKSIKMIKAPFNYSRGFGRENDPQKVPKQYRGMVGWSAYYRVMKELQSLGTKYKFEVVVLTYKPPNLIRNISLQLGFHMVDLTLLWEEYASEQNLQDANAAWRIYKDDSHPSVTAHKFTANILSKVVAKLIGIEEKPGRNNKPITKFEKRS